MNLVLGYTNEVLTGTVLASATVSDLLGPAQLQNDQGSPSTAWQTPRGTLTATLTLQRAYNTAWRAFGLFRTNLTATAAVTWRVYANGAVVYTGVTRPVVPGYRQAVHVKPDTPVIGDTLVVTIEDPNNPDGFLNVPQAYAGAGLQLYRTFNPSSAILKDESTTTARTRGGAEYVRNDWQRRGFDLSLGALRPGEVSRVLQLDAVARRGTNILLVPDLTSAGINGEAVFGRLIPQSGIGYADNTDQRRTWRAQIMERL